MRIKLIFIALVYLSAFARDVIGQTVIKDNSKVYGTWSVSNSPFLIEGSAEVPSGKKLTIEPGVVVKFKSSARKNYGKDFEYQTVKVGYLRVFGEISAIGTISQPILFLPSQDGYWGGIAVENSNKPNIFRYCRIRYANTVFRIYDGTFSLNGLSFEGSKGSVEYCEITSCRSIGLSLRYSEVKVFSTLLNKNYLGVLLYVTNSEVKNCIIVNSEDLGVLSRYSSATIINSIIWKNKNGGLETRNQAIIIDGRLTNITELNPKVKTYVEFSLIQDSEAELLEGYYLKSNLYSKNPKFLSKADFQLKPKSPCIGKGINGGDIGLFLE